MISAFFSNEKRLESSRFYGSLKEISFQGPGAYMHFLTQNEDKEKRENNKAHST